MLQVRNKNKLGGNQSNSYKTGTKILNLKVEISIMLIQCGLFVKLCYCWASFKTYEVPTYSCNCKLQLSCHVGKGDDSYDGLRRLDQLFK